MAAKRIVSEAPHWCSDCEEIVHLVPVYECGTCSDISLERRCENCRKFMGRRDEDGCENCMAECQPVEVVTDHDGTIIRAEDYVADGPSLAERRTVAEAEHKAQRAAAEKQKSEQAYAGATATPWSAVKVGDEILAFTREGDVDTLMGNQTIFSLQTVGPNPAADNLAPGQIIATLFRYGPTLEIHNADDTAYVVNDPERTTPEPPATERFTVGTTNYASGGAVKYISADMGADHHSGSFAPVGIITGRSSINAGSLTGIATFADPAEAEAFAAAARTAAANLVATGIQDEEFPLELDAQKHSFPDAPARYVSFKLGMDDFNEKQIMEVSTGNTRRPSMVFSVHAPSVLLNIAAAADHVAAGLRKALDA